MDSVRVSVKTLVEHSLRRGDLTRELFEFGHPLEGTRAHQRIQSSRPTGYRKEVFLSHTFEVDGRALDVQGRADGVFEEAGRMVIEEIKTTRRDLAGLAEEQNSLHWGQLQVYAFLFARAEGLQEVECRLTYYHLDSRESTQLSRVVAVGQLRELVEELVESYLTWADGMVRWARARDASIMALEFPFGSYRRGQRRMAVAVYRSIQAGGQLLIEAPTGIGKTIASIFPAVKALAKGLAGGFVYLTARTTGQRAVESAFAELRRQGLRLKTLTLTARDRICFSPGKACNGEECEFARGYYDRLRPATEALFEYDCLDRATVELVARRHSVCPFELSLELARWVDVWIGDYNYVFDPRVSLRRATESPDQELLLVDEAHNLLERAREMHSAELVRSAFAEAARQTGGGNRKIRRSLERVIRWMSLQENRLVPGEPVAETLRPPDLERLLRSLCRQLQGWFADPRNRAAPGKKTLLALYFEVVAFLRIGEQYDHTYCTCYAAQGGDVRVRLFCLDPSSQIRRTLGDSRAAVLFSATLKPLRFYRQCLGCTESAETLELAPPFASENLCLIVADGVSTRFNRRTETRHQLTRLLSEFSLHRCGNYLFFFPSYQYLQMIYEEFVRENPQVQTLRQQTEMTLEDRDAFLDRFLARPSSSIVGFAVMGGLFAEGIDLVGDRLAGVGVVGVGLPAVCLERELIRRYFASLGSEGFEFAYRYPGMTRVRQAAGRLIRSETDRGAVLLIDERFSTAPYRSLLPLGWHPIRIRNVGELIRELDSFWTGCSRPSTRGVGGHAT